MKICCYCKTIIGLTEECILDGDGWHHYLVSTCVKIKDAQFVEAHARAEQLEQERDKLLSVLECANATAKRRGELVLTLREALKKIYNAQRELYPIGVGISFTCTDTPASRDKGDA